MSNTVQVAASLGALVLSLVAVGINAALWFHRVRGRR